eukprot:TRINITY_DN10489_c0_g1_i2.p1 TRINITY_DN10489_c0_g1~~TRINITY_DN10489_c0_g1_i2.p1  ORF type:complete len:333 (+),score=79.40 TRINITY_DN10489_c0_g1_i2:172-1170(+)
MATAVSEFDSNQDGIIDMAELRASNKPLEIAQKVLEFAREHVGSGKDIDDVHDAHKYGVVPGVHQRHKWGFDPLKGTPLQMCASVAGSAEACRFLLDHGADINFCVPELGRNGAPPIFNAIKTGDIALVKMFLEQGADRSIGVEVSDQGRVDAVQYARTIALNTGSEHALALSRLVEYHSMPFGPVDKPPLANSYDAIVADGPLAYAQGHIGAGYDINDMYAGKQWARLDKFTPLACVVEAGSIEATRFLIAAGADVNCLNGKLGGPLHFAVQQGNIAMCKVLLDAGADRHAKTAEPDSQSALELAKGMADSEEPGPDARDIQRLIEYYNSV